MGRCWTGYGSGPQGTELSRAVPVYGTFYFGAQPKTGGQKEERTSIREHGWIAH